MAVKKKKAVKKPARKQAPPQKQAEPPPLIGRAAQQTLIAAASKPKQGVIKGLANKANQGGITSSTATMRNEALRKAAKPKAPKGDSMTKTAMAGDSKGLSVKDTLLGKLNSMIGNKPAKKPIGSGRLNSARKMNKELNAAVAKGMSRDGTLNAWLPRESDRIKAWTGDAEAATSHLHRYRNQKTPMRRNKSYLKGVNSDAIKARKARRNSPVVKNTSIYKYQ